MKKYLLIVVTFLLASCAPTAIRTGVELTGSAVELAQNDPATLTFDGKDALFTNRGSDDVTGDPSRPGDRAVLVVVGTPDLVVSGNAGNGGQACVRGERPGYWRCFRALIPPGFAFRVTPTTGAIQSGTALYHRPSRGALLLKKSLP